MPKWSNWSGKLTSRIDALHFIRNEEAACELARQCDAGGQNIRVVGAGHSHSPLVLTNSVLADSSGLSGVISADRETCSAWVWAGTRIYALGRTLHEAGLALHNQGDIDRQAIAGAVATGTHGTGTTLGNLSSRVIGAQIALASGELVNVSDENNPQLFQAAQMHLGSLGIVTRLHLQLRDAYRLRQRNWNQPLASLLVDLDEQMASNRHFEFFWYPETDTAEVKVINETMDPPEYPLSDSNRVGWSYEVLPSHRPHAHTEMEYSLAAEDGIACLIDIQRLLKDRFPEVRWPVEYRSVAADNVWLSTAFDRPTVTISVHQDISADDEPYFRACEEIFLQYNGKPHWGKTNYLDGTQLKSLHPRWDAWWQARDAADPHGTFLNDYMASIRP